MSTTTPAPVPAKRVNLRTPDVMAAVQSQVESHYRSAVVERIRAGGGTLTVDGVTVHLAKQFGFCYGVERAIDLAYAARKVFADKRVFILGEIIHNPEVNRQIADMGVVNILDQKGEANVDDIVKGDGVLHVVGSPSQSLTWAELASAAKDRSKLPEGMEPGLSHELDFDGQNSTFPFGAHVAVVEVDSETGKVQLLRHVAVDDCGKILNPMLVKGQQHGGIAQGAAQALFEWVQYDESGNPITATLVDYSIPSAAELPSFETYNTETPTPRNPLGAKGIGESGTIGSTPAIQNAVVDALSHLGVRHIDMPTTPERVWKAIAAVA